MTDEEKRLRNREYQRKFWKSKSPKERRELRKRYKEAEVMKAARRIAADMQKG